MINGAQERLVDELKSHMNVALYQSMRGFDNLYIKLRLSDPLNFGLQIRES